MTTSKNTQIIEAKTKGFNKAKQNIKGVNKSLGGMAKQAALAAAAMWGAKKLLDGMKASINLAAEQELAEKKLEAALGGVSKELKQYARELQQVSRFGDEVTLGAMAMIASFVKDEKAIKMATKASMDLAAAKGMDLVAAADLVSKSLGSSTNALSRYGIEVTGAVGSTERLESLTNNLAAVFGGQAQEQANTYTGQIDQMNNAIGDLGEAIGDKLLPFLEKAANLVKWTAEKLTALVENARAAGDAIWEFFGVEVAKEVEDRINNASGAFRKVTETISTGSQKIRSEGQLNINKFNLLVDALKEVVKEEGNRSVIINKIKSEYGTYLGNINLEKATLEQIAAFQKDITNQMTTRLRVQVGEEEILEVMREEQKLIKEINKLKGEIHLKELANSIIRGDNLDFELYLNQKQINELIKNEDKIKDLNYQIEQKNLKIDANRNKQKLLIHQLSELGIEFDNLESSIEGAGISLADLTYKAMGGADQFKELLATQRDLRDSFIEEAEGESTLEDQLQAYMDFYETRNELVEISEQEHADIIAHYQGQISDRNKDEIKQRVSDTVAGLDEIGNQFKAFKKVAQAAAIAETIYSTYYAAQEAYTNWIESKLPIDPATKQALGVANAALAVGQGMARVNQIRKAAVGADYIADEPQLLMVGEQGLRERVQVTPLDGVNIEGGTQGITLNIQGNVLTDSFVEESIVPSLREALRQGEVLA
tara:strand:+ start:171 stop:2309 length:2139 start_codon:yes stop_codon:yes gene_type:complete